MPIIRPEFRSKNELVYDALLQSIIQGEYEPGSRLVIDELATTLGVSQIPIREAVRQLEADGFVSVEPYVGATISDINAEFVIEVFALLESLEIICSRAACQHMNETQFKTLTNTIETMASVVHDADQWSQENKALHLFICECAQMQLVLKMMTKVLDHWDRLRRHYLTDVFANRIKVAQHDHEQILQAFHTRNPDEVEQAIRAHNQRALESYIEHLQAAGHIEIDN